MVRKIGFGLAVMLGACLALASTAEARGYRHHARALTVRPVLVPAHLRPDYVGAPGYPGGAPGPRVPALVDVGFVGAVPTFIGVNALSPNLFVGVPVLGDIRL